NAKSDWVSRNDKPDAPLENTDEMGTSSRPPATIAHGEAVSLTAATGSTPTTRKIARTYPKEVAAPRDAAGSASHPDAGSTPASGSPSSPARLATEENSHGVEFYPPDGESFWVDATKDLPEDFHPSWLNARVDNDEGMTGTVVGFPVAGSDERLDC